MELTVIISQSQFLKRTNLIRTIWLNWVTGQKGFRLFVYPRVHIARENDSIIRVNGCLHIGTTWPRGRYYDSELKLQSKAVFEVQGCFNIFTGCQISVNEGAVLSLGSGYINRHVSIDCFESIIIGDEVAIAKGVVIRDCDNHKINGASDRSPIKIGNRVWIGTSATILKGVAIGDGAVVAAGAVVTRDIPSGSLAAGVPARVIKENVCWK